MYMNIYMYDHKTQDMSFEYLYIISKPPYMIALTQAICVEIGHRWAIWNCVTKDILCLQFHDKTHRIAT